MAEDKVLETTPAQPTEKSATEQEAPKSFLAGLTPEHKAELTAFARDLFKPEREEFAKEIKSLRRERDKFKQASELDAEGLAKLTDAEALREESIGFYVSKGIPEELLQLGRGLSEVRRIADVYGRESVKGLEERVAIALKSKEPQSTQGNGTDATKERTTPVPDGAGVRPRNITGDNIDVGYLDGTVSGQEYHAFLATGQLPK